MELVMGKYWYIYTIKKYILETVLLLIKPLVSRYKSTAFSLQKI